MSSYIARTRKLQKHASDQGEVLKISGGGGSVIAMKRNACNNRCVSSGGLFNTGPRFVSPSSILEKRKISELKLPKLLHLKMLVLLLMIIKSKLNTR